MFLINTTALWKNSVLFFSTLLAFNFCIDFIDFIFLYFYHHLCNYCNRVFSDQSSYVVCRCLYRGLCYFSVWKMACDVLGKANQLTGNNKGERRYKISHCKVCFLGRKDKECTWSSAKCFWAFLQTEMTHFPTLSYTSAREIATLFYTWSLKKVTSSAWSLPI